MNSEAEFKYWCFNCQKPFQQTTSAECCRFCSSPAIELSEENAEDPSKFQVYQMEMNNPQPNPPNTNINPQQYQQQVMSIGPFQISFSQGVVSHPNQPNFTQMSFNIGQMMESMHNLMERTGLNQLLNSLIGQPNLVPASNEDRSRLEQVDTVQECSICQQEGGQMKGYKLQCGHKFHIDCLNPWFERTNTCPSCRQTI